MIRETSRLSLAEVAHTLPARRREVWNELTKRFAPATAAELAWAMGSHHVNKRLSELERLGLVVAGEPQRCSTTGRMAIGWAAVTDLQAEAPVTRRKPKVDHAAKWRRFCGLVER